MSKACSQIEKGTTCPLEQIVHTIDDYRHAFPNEKSTFLKKLGQVSVVASIAAVVSGYFFGDSVKAKAIATGSGLVIGTVIANLGQIKTASTPRRPLEAHEIRQVYAYLS
ncbi:MAG: hypothetical protein EOM37_04000 [Proteobacteria bacterium]|jgi:hypothetical protein|nr:hypothetical protein [Alphaproteobacteria bacterium]NCC03198.1 hypothetical protein [Pseudomonadota bacterium]